jgi:purine-nucleoside phosphorylase
MGDNPLVGVNDDRLGPRFPDMSQPYDAELIEKGLEIARQNNFVAHRGVTVAVTGPNLETRAEYRFLRAIGADVVGMSTVPEAIVAVHCGLRTFGLAVVTDMCFPDALEPANVEQIIATANAAEPRLRALGCEPRITPQRHRGHLEQTSSRTIERRNINVISSAVLRT